MASGYQLSVNVGFSPKHMLLYTSEHILCRQCQAMATVIYICITCYYRSPGSNIMFA